LAEWLYEAGVGEARAALVEDGRIVEAQVERDGGDLRVGAVLAARLLEPTLVGLPDGREAVLDRPPRGITLGAALTVAIVREAIPEPGRPKRAKAVPTDAAPAPGPTLRERLVGAPVRQLRAHEPDALEGAGWGELIEEALTGEIAFHGGALRLTPTPAMTLFDVDGTGDLAALAVRAAAVVGEAVRRHGIGGSIGIDFPTLAGKAPRQAVAAALDAALPPPFERTAVNGFGFLQIVRPRARASLPELLRADRVLTAALAALRAAERAGGHPVHVSTAVAARIAATPAWTEALSRRLGRVPIFTA
jgi:ribonuclease G